MISAIDRTYNYNTPLALLPDPGSFTASPGTSAFSNKWAYDIPIALYLANKEWPLGLYQAAVQNVDVALSVRFNPLAGAPGSCVYTGNSGNLTGQGSGSVVIHQEYFDPVPTPEAEPPLVFLHRWRSSRVPLTADTDLEIPLPSQNMYLRMIYAVVTGGVGALGLNATVPTRFRLMFGGNQTPYDETVDQMKSRMYRYYGNTLPAGVFVTDLLEETHTERDWIDSRNITDLRAVITTSGGTYSGGAYVEYAVEELIPLVSRAA
jgi:hypothetical protein